jgi:hypothetical protein
MDTTHAKLIIVYGIQRTHVKNCFYDEPCGRAINIAWDEQNPRNAGQMPRILGV